MSMSRILPLAFILILTANAQCAHRIHGLERKNLQEIKIKHVQIKTLGEEDFKTIAEYFDDGIEHNYYRCTIRDLESQRNGTYFIVGFNATLSRLPKELFIKISIIISLKEGPMEFIFALPNKRPKLTTEVYCGLTSNPTNPDKIRAWKAELIDKNGKILCSKQSYMWTEF